MSVQTEPVKTQTDPHAATSLDWLRAHAKNDGLLTEQEKTEVDASRREAMADTALEIGELVMQDGVLVTRQSVEEQRQAGQDMGGAHWRNAGH